MPDNSNVDETLPNRSKNEQHTTINMRWSATHPIAMIAGSGALALEEMRSNNPVSTRSCRGWGEIISKEVLWRDDASIGLMCCVSS